MCAKIVFVKRRGRNEKVRGPFFKPTHPLPSTAKPSISEEGYLRRKKRDRFFVALESSKNSFHPFSDGLKDSSEK